MKIVRTKDVEWAPALQRGHYSQRRKPLGGDKLTAGLWELAPGKKSFPFHKHLVTEEAMYVVSGTGKVRADDGLHPIGPGDYVSFPPGGSAHQLVNDGAEPLVYLGLASTVGVDLVEYPDTDKIAAALGAPGKGQRFVFAKGGQVDYFHGDKDAEESGG